MNNTLEELALEEINKQGKYAYYNKNKLKSITILYSPFITSIREYYRANRNVRKNIEKKFGLPMWDRLVELNIEKGKLAVIPVAKTSSESVEAIIYIFKNEKGKMKFHIAERGKFNKYPVNSTKQNGKQSPDREFVLSQFLHFDKIIFQYSGCDIIDEYKTLLKNIDNNLKSASSQICFYDSYILETPHYYEVYVDGELIKREYSYSTYEYDVEYYCVEVGGGSDGGSSTGGGTGDNSGNNSTGGKTWYPSGENPCIGDPVMEPTIAPSNTYGNIAGGTFGWTRTGANGCPVFHNGLDIAGNVGNDLHAMFDGVVDDIQPNNIGSNGKFVTIISEIDGETYWIKMIHMNDVYVNKGDYVKQGAIIGEIGATGNAYNVPYKHVHVSMKLKLSNGAWTDYINPLPFMSTNFNSDWSANPCIGNFN